jgi:hypothetical protein
MTQVVLIWCEYHCEYHLGVTGGSSGSRLFQLTSENFTTRNGLGWP